MIFLDANVFVRHLVAPVTPQDVAMAAAAAALFEQVEQGQTDVTTSEATLAEVVFNLSNKSHYHVPRETVEHALKRLLLPHSFRLPTKAICLRGLELWSTNPRISFPDGLAAAYSELRGHPLATFEKRLSRLPGVTPHDWPASG